MSSEFQNVLAIDSSSLQMKLALQFAGDRLVKSTTEVVASHGQEITKKIHDLMSSAAIVPADLEAIVVSTGPGSFTGLRIGIALAKGMATALQIPVVGLNLFDLAARRLGDIHRDVLVIVPYKKDEYFATTVRGGTCRIDRIETFPAKELLERVQGCSVAAPVSAPEGLAEAADDDFSHRVRYDGSHLIEAGLYQLAGRGQTELAQLEPMYVQKSQAELNFERRKQQ